jgi:cytochrome oxidase Cu insertion factor (SCO1/SenC/PrrC family)
MSNHPSCPEPPRKSFHGIGAVVIFVGIAVMISLVWTQWQQAQRRGGQVLEVHGKLRPIQLLDAIDGKETTLPDTNGNFIVLSVLATREGGVAPMLAGRMKELSQHLDRMGEDRVRLVTITTDPAHDSAEVLAAYATEAAANPDRWRFYTGPGAELKSWIEKDLFGPLLDDGEAFPSAPTRLVLLDPDGSIRAYRDAQNPGVVGNLLNDLGALDREFLPNPKSGHSQTGNVKH